MGFNAVPRLDISDCAVMISCEPEAFDLELFLIIINLKRGKIITLAVHRLVMELLKSLI